MQALLLSPATHFSPDSSSDSSFGSPSTPPPPSLDFLNHSPSSPSSGSSFATATQGYDTPTRAPPARTPARAQDDDFPTPKTPAWLTDALGEEWVPQPAAAAEEDSPPETPSASFTTAGNSTQATVVPPTRTPLPLPAAAAYNSLSLRNNTAPRVPSSLRHGFTASTASSALASDATGTTEIDVDGGADSVVFGGQGEEGTSVLDFAASAGAEASVFLLGSSLPPSAAHPDNTFGAGGETEYEREEENEQDEEEGASTGSCVINSVVERGGSAGGAGRGGTQLQAAVRALRGPGGGIFAADDEDDEGEGQRDGDGGSEEKGKVVGKGKGREKGGLMSLFEPPSPEEKPPKPRLQSTLPAGPTLSSFTFSPPSPHSPSSPHSPHSPNQSASSNAHANSSSRWKDLMHFSPSPPPKPANPTLQPPSSTPPHPHRGGAAHYRRQPPQTPGFATDDDDATPIAYRAPPAAAAYHTPAGAAETPSGTPAAATGAGAAAGPRPTVPTGVGRRERFLHRSTTSRLGASTSSSAAASVAAPRPAVERDAFTDEEDEEEDSEDVPFVPPPVLPAGELGSEEMSTTSDSESESASESEDEGAEEEGAGEGWSGSVVVRTEEGEEEGFTSESESETEQHGVSRVDGRDEGRGEEEAQGEKEEDVDLPSRSMSALPSPPSANGNAPATSAAAAAHDGRFSFSLSSSSLDAPDASHLSGASPSSLPLPLPKSPARIPFTSPNPTLSAAPHQQQQQPPKSPYKLFQPTYDTVTRTHLLSLVDEIDSLSATPDALVHSLLHGAPAAPQLQAQLERVQEEHGEEGEGEEEGDKSEEGFLGEEGAVRSSKRIKLSPRSEYEASFAAAPLQPRDDDDDTERSYASAAVDEVGTPIPPPRRRTRTRTRTRTPPASSFTAQSRRRTPASASGRPQLLRRSATPFSPASESPAAARSARSARSSRLPDLPSPVPLSSSVSASGYYSRPQTPSSTSLSGSGSAQSTPAPGAGLAPPPPAFGQSVTKSARSRQRLQEAEAVMERVRGLVEKREGRKRTGDVETTPRPLRSPLKRASPGSSPSDSSSPQPHHDDTLPSDSPPPLPHLAAAASASLRATLSLGSPLPSPNPSASRSSTFSSTASNPASNLNPPPPPNGLAASTSPALGSAPRLPSGLPAEKAGSIGRRHFARTPLSAKKKNDKREGGGKKKGEARGLLGMTKGVRGIWGTEEEDHEQDEREAEVELADREEGGFGEVEDVEQGEEHAHGEEARDDMPSLPTVSSSAYNSLSNPSSSSSSTGQQQPRRGHARGSSLTTLHPASLQTQRLLASAGASAREKGLVFDEKVGRWIRTPRRLAASVGAVQEEEGEEEEAVSPTKAAAAREDDDDEEDPFRDFSELRSSHSIRVPVSPTEQHQQQPHETISNLDLDALPRGGDGSGCLPRGVDRALDLSGLGISKGTPPSLVPTRLPSPPRAPSPADACYFSPPPAEKRPDGEGHDGPELVLESEDSATWGRADGEKKRDEAERLFEPEEQDADDEFGAAAETSMLSLYRAAHDAAGEQQDGTEEDDQDDASDLSSPDIGTLDSRAGALLSQQRRQQQQQQQPHSFSHRPTSSTPSALSPASRPTAPATPAHSSYNPSSTPARSVPPPVPRSALKQPVRSQSDPLAGAATTTPLRNASLEPKIPRSVSFSDGKTSGKIEGLVPFEEQQGYRPSPLSQGRFGGPFADDDSTVESLPEGPGELEFDERFDDRGGAEDADRTVTQDSFGALPPSTRTRRIGDALNELGKGPDDSPFSRPFAQAAANASTVSDNLSFRRRSFTRTNSAPTGNLNANATFLTECSFGVSHDRLLQFITDVEPFEPDWEGLRSIDLSGKKAESVVRMKEFLPSLDEVNLNNNQLTYLTGAPSTLRTLLISSNLLSSLTSFQHLPRLERLDLSNNELDSVHQLACLVHLRELKADGNQIRNLDGLGGLDALVKVSLKGNELEEVDFGKMKWSRLETLHLARNKISSVRNLDKLASLSSLNLDHNLLTSLEAAADMPRLRVLRLCSNPIADIDIAFAPKLRTLYIDSARLGTVQGTERLRKLENLSVRDQSGGAMTLSMAHIRDAKRLYLSGNPLPRSFPSEKFFNLVYLELAMCQLTSLPDNLASVIPNVRVLTLDYNFLDDLAPLAGLSRLTKLSAVGARLSKARPVAKVLSSLAELETVDLRMNPFTLAFYPPLVPSSEGLLPSHAEHRILHPDDLATPSSISDPSTSSKSWQVLDTKFRRALPDEWYHKRAAYRAVVLQSAPALVRLDGIDCAKERPRLAKKLEKLASKQVKAAVA
ncbi:hypothetical protein JCM6882_005862 [Rhodosporidiobolus microsporus]